MGRRSPSQGREKCSGRLVAIPRRSLQAVKSWVRGTVYMQRSKPLGLFLVVLAPQIAILNEYQGVFVLVTEKAFDAITIQSKVIPFEHGKYIT